MTDNFWLMWTMALDGAARTIIPHMEAAGLRPVVLKGPTIAQWIYDEPGDRIYSDLDVLVAPDRRLEAVAVLTEIGYHRQIDESMLHTSSLEEMSLADGNGVTIDLHIALKGVKLPAERAWEVLDEATVPFDVGGTTTRALAPPARAMHLALHLAQRGMADGKAAIDLRRGLDRLDEETWRAAARLAHDLEAAGSFFAGMALLPEGFERLREYGMQPPTDRETRMRAASASSSALFVERVFAAPSWSQRLRVIRGRLFPSRRWLAVHRPATKDSPRALWRARLCRPFEVLSRLPAAFRERHHFD